MQRIFHGRLAEGRSARQRDLAIVLEGDRLRFVGDEDAAPAPWPYAEIALIEDENAAGPTRLRHGESRLTIDDPGFGPVLLAAVPALRRRRRHPLYISIVSAILFLGLASAGWWGVPRMARMVAEMIPPAWEEHLGDQFLGDMPGSRCTAPEGSAALAALVDRLIAGIAIPYHVEVVVLDEHEVNAFALPGGRIVLLKGLIDEAQSPDEVAGVLAHELTHSLRRHPTRSLIASSGVSFLVDLATGAGTFSSAGTLVVTQSFSRGFEAEADAGAVELLRRAGIGTGGFAAFFARLAKQEPGGGLPPFLASHPAPEARLKAVEAAPSAGTTPALTAAQWDALRHICPDE